MADAPSTALSALRSGLARVGGPTSTSWRTVAAMSALLVVDRIGTDLEATGEPLLLISSALAGALAIAAVLGVARLTLLRSARPRPLVAMLAMAAAALAAALLGRAHDATVGLPVHAGTAHLVERTIWGFAFLNILVVGIDAVTEHRRELERLTARAATLERTRAEVDQLLATAPRDEIARVATEVRADLAALEGADLATALARLRHAGEEVVRARSHELSRPVAPYRAPDHLPVPRRARIGELVLDATAEGPLRPGLVALVAGTWVAANVLGTSGPLDALFAGSLVGGAALVTFGLVGRVVARTVPTSGKAMRAILGLAAPLVAAIVWLAGMRAIVAALELPIAISPGAPSPVRLTAQAVLLSAIPIAQGLGRAARRRGRLAVDERRALTEALELEVARANTTLWARRRALARALHGPVQAAVNAATLRLAAAERDGSPDTAAIAPAVALAVGPAVGPAIAQARDEVEAALAALERAVAEDALDAGDDLAAAIGRICGLWEGVADIEVRIADDLAAELASDPDVTAALIDVLTEACSNAVRHGRARHVRAHVERGPGRVTLEVVDDGRAGGPPGDPGQGSALLDEVALAWRRSDTDSGARLTVALARS